MSYSNSWKRNTHGYMLRTIKYYVYYEVIYVASVSQRKMF